jgi:maltooligosyltrehalose trehalohydrolase
MPLGYCVTKELQQRMARSSYRDIHDQAYSKPNGVAGFPRRHGAWVCEWGVVFNLWAPSAKSVELIEVGQPPRRMPKDRYGWYQTVSQTAHAGTRYQFLIDGKLRVPDPASHFQPEDVSQPSEVIALEQLRDRDIFPGRPWSEAVIYELHVGTFSDSGTFAGVEARLPYLRDLGITAIELMPLNDVPGRRNWGYDGVLLNAPNAHYGRPEDLKRLIRSAHALDIMVYLDVVYNHFGPHLNYLHTYAESFFTQRHHTGWGPALNLDDEGGAFVRQFLIENALMWVRDYGFDGLRFDAVHALKDDSNQHFLFELATSIREQTKDRHIHLMLENEANQARYLDRSGGRTAYFDAQWGDDFHNALHVLLTGETEGYYAAFANNPLSHLARSLTEGFAFQGETFPIHNKPRGERSAHLPPEATIFFAQNHDQIGNRAFGERLSSLVSVDKLKQAMALVALSPHVPLLFMGEESATTTPFLFFCDWEGELAQGTRDGRRKEFSTFKAFSTPEMRGEIPDPCAHQTFLASCLDWQKLDHEVQSLQFRAFTKNLLRIRSDKIVPMIKEGFVSAEVRLLESAGLDVRWRTAKGLELRILANFTSRDIAASTAFEGERVWQSAQVRGQVLGPDAIVVLRGAALQTDRFARAPFGDVEQRPAADLND